MKNSLGFKITLTVFLIFIIYICLVYWVHYFIITPGFLELEKSEGRRNIERVIAGIKREIHQLDLFTFDWSAWDDTARFVIYKNKDYIENNLQTIAFKNTHIDLMYFYNIMGGIVWKKVLEPDTVKEIHINNFPLDNLPLRHPFISQKNVKKSVSGILMTEKGPLLIVARAVTNNENTPVISGTIIIGRFLDKSMVKSLMEQTQLKIQIWPVDNNIIPPDKRDVFRKVIEGDLFFVTYKDILKVYSELNDLYGNPVLLIEADTPRDIAVRGIRDIKYALYSISVIGPLVILILFLLIRKNVIVPITQVTEHTINIAEYDDLSLQLNMKRYDEIGILATEIDRMVLQLGDVRKKLLEQSYVSGMAEMASGMLHNIRNILSPVKSNLSFLQQELNKTSIEEIKIAHKELLDNKIEKERKDDLKKFLDLALDDFKGLYHNMNNKLNDIDKHIQDIEYILSEQDDLGLAKKPKETIKLKELIADSLNILPDIYRNNITVEMDNNISGIEPLQIHRLSMLNILHNILINSVEAIQKMGNNNGLISISVIEEDYIHIKILDNGIGIPPENLVKIFERGFSAKGKNTSGIGLHWCSNTIFSMGGNIYATSEGTGKGACFHILLPKGD